MTDFKSSSLLPNAEEGIVIVISKGTEYPDKSLEAEHLKTISTVQTSTRYEIGNVSNVTACLRTTVS